MFLQAKQFGVTITTSLDLYECYNQGLGSQLSCSESHTNIYTSIDKQKMTHAIYNILSYSIRSSSAGDSQGNVSININMSLKSRFSNKKIIKNDDTNEKNSMVYVSYEVSYIKHRIDSVIQIYEL